MFRYEAATSGLDEFPIVASESLPQQRLTPPSLYEAFPPVSYYGAYPYQYYQQYPMQQEEPFFVVMAPPAKPKKSKPKTIQHPVKDTRPQPEKLRQPTKPSMDIKLVRAIQQLNSKFVIDKFVFVPGKRIEELSTSETAPVKATSVIRPQTKNLQQVLKSQKLELQRQEEEEETATVKVESVGMSAADQPIPDYSGFFPRQVFTQPGSGDEATLILEPNSRALSGNGGTSISTPLSRAILRKGTAVKVLFKPQSVAITGAGGIAHAQADLLLDFIEDE